MKQPITALSFQLSACPRHVCRRNRVFPKHMVGEAEFISCSEKTRWKLPFAFTDISGEYLTNCPVDYSLLRNPFSNKPEELNPDEEEKLWQFLGIVRPTADELPHQSTENPFYTTSVPPLHSKRELKRLRQAERQNKLEKWYDLPKPDVTEEDRDDLEVIRLRRALAVETHVRRSDTKTRYFQHGVVVDDPSSFYDRVPRKQRGKTIVDELLSNAELMKQQRKRYARLQRATAEKRAAVHRQKQQRLKRLKNKTGRKQSTILVPE
ncbi:Deoxynucleotidyltransferase terminal-interacting protein 2 [Clonorchis sinensis]|uniref:Deoxynucleotidyltransferase terminal-interacting protein 2 n=1 Tax=Clonorchis sinensis TaxID=79923 RepID=A0A3R7DB91_CLOSI|nr:Deoxynucleotidyltransferase terminal-interacting protein 2 [Clonorchis sinensis]